MEGGGTPEVPLQTLVPGSFLGVPKSLVSGPFPVRSGYPLARTRMDEGGG